MPDNAKKKLAEMGAGEVAAMAVEKAADSVAGKVAGKVGGAMVQPAIWAISGEQPDAVDIGLWGGGLFASGPAGWALLGTGAIKAMVDGSNADKLEEVKRSEPQKYRPGIQIWDDYSTFPSNRAAETMKIASLGGVTWQHPNGLWVFIQDATGKLVCDYQPAVYKEKYFPKLPLDKGAGGRFRWTSASK